MRCLYKPTVCKILAEMKAGSPVDCFIIYWFDRSSERARNLAKLYAQAPFPKRGAKASQFRLIKNTG